MTAPSVHAHISRHLFQVLHCTSLVGPEGSSAVGPLLYLRPLLSHDPQALSGVLVISTDPLPFYKLYVGVFGFFPGHRPQPEYPSPSQLASLIFRIGKQGPRFSLEIGMLPLQNYT